MDKKLWEIKCYIKVNEKTPQMFCFKMKWCSFNEIPLGMGCCLRGHLPMCTAHARFQNGAYSRHRCAERPARQRDADIKWLLCQSLTAPDGQAARFPPVLLQLGLWVSCFSEVVSCEALCSFFHINPVRFLFIISSIYLFSSQSSVSQYPYLSLTSIIVPDAPRYLLFRHTLIEKMDRERRFEHKKHGECVRSSHTHAGFIWSLESCVLAQILQESLP